MWTHVPPRSDPTATIMSEAILMSRKIDIQFLVLMVDLWSADGEHQRNVVMHTTPNTRPTTPPSRGRDEDFLGSARPGTASSRPVTASSRPPTASSRPATGYASAFSPGLANPGWRLSGECYKLVRARGPRLMLRSNALHGPVDVSRPFASIPARARPDARATAHPGYRVRWYSATAPAGAVSR